MGILSQTQAQSMNLDSNVGTPLEAITADNNNTNNTNATTNNPSGTGSGLIGGAINAVTGGLLSNAVGWLFQGENDKNQINQQQKLDNMQLSMNEQEQAYNQQLNLAQWKATSYPAQVQEMEMAGLNPALLYGGGGGGGGSLGNASGTVSGATASDSASRENASTNAAQMGMELSQMKLIQAQTDAAEATAENQKAQAAKTAGIDTTNAQATTPLINTQVQSLTQGIANQQATEALTKTQTQLANISDKIQSATITDQIQMIDTQATTMIAQMRSALADADVGEKTQQSRVELVAQTLYNAISQNKNINADTDVKSAQATVAQYGAALAKAGIAPDSPWYVKIIGDISSKLGLTTTNVADGVKGTQK